MKRIGRGPLRGDSLNHRPEHQFPNSLARKLPGQLGGLVNTRFLTELEVNQRTGISVDTLRRWRLEDKGPIFRKFGSLVRYGDEDLAIWEDRRVAGGDGANKLPPVRPHGPEKYRAAG